MNFTFLGGFAILFYVLKSIFLQLVALYKFFCLRFIETYYILMLQYSKSIFNSNQNKLMSQAEHQPSSHTQTRTQKSPQRQRPGINYLSNHSIHTHNSNPQLEYLKLKQQARREVENYLKQIQLLKDELFRKNDEIQHLKSTVIMNLKKDLNDTQRDNIKNYKENQRQARQIEKLRADNFSMQQQIQKNSKQKRSYFAKLEDLKEIKETTKRQILEKDKIIRTYAEQNKRLQKEVSNSRIQIQDLSEQINEKEKRLFQSESQYKSILQKNFVIQSELKSLQLRQRDHQIMVNSYKQKIGQLQKQKEDLLEKIDEEDYSRNISQDRTQSIGQTQMLQVKALMEQIYNLLDEKKQQNKVSQKKFLASISCLERTLSKK